MSSQYTIASITTLLHRLVDSDPTVRAHAAGWLGVLGDARATFSLSCCLRDENDDDVRISMIRALAKIADPLALDVLIEMHKDQQQIIMEEAAAAIRSISIAGLHYARVLLDSPEATERLLAVRILQELNAIGILSSGQDNSLISLCASHALFDNEMQVKISMAGMLGSLADEQAIQPLLTILTTEQDYKLLASAARSLGYFPQEDTTRALEWAMQQASGLLHEEAAMALAHQATPTAINILVDALQDSSTMRRAVIISALGQIVDPHAIRTIITALSDKDLTIRISATRALIRLCSASNSQIYNDLLYEALPILLFLLQDDNEVMRATAAKALAFYDKTEIILPMIALLNDKSATVRAAAVNALHFVGDTRPLFPLRFALRDQDVHVRRAAIAALSSYPCRHCIEPCAISAIKDDDNLVRIVATTLLTECRNPDFLGTMINALSDSEPMTAIAIMKIMYNSGHENQLFFSKLTEMLNSPDTAIRKQSLFLLLELNNSISTNLLVALQHDQHLIIRLKVAIALSQCSDIEKATAMLRQRLLEEYDDTVRVALTESLERIVALNCRNGRLL